MFHSCGESVQYMECDFDHLMEQQKEKDRHRGDGLLAIEQNGKSHQGICGLIHQLRSLWLLASSMGATSGSAGGYIVKRPILPDYIASVSPPLVTARLRNKNK
ncbi:uncharacterized protein Dsimw501_GD16345, isoform B [Drosophila simulans]|nr:uncharacterized protein Dsimw501_GD16345, isoform B [Drosophila simulans]